MHNLGQVLLFLQDLLALGAQRHELGEVLLVVVVEGAHVLAVAEQPVDGRKVLALGELLVQTPEDLHNVERGRGDRIGEVTAGRRDGAHNGDGALACRIADALDATGALVERGETRRQVGRIAGVGGHFGQAARDLAQRFGPARRRVGHHGHVVAHVAEVLAERDAGVDGGLAGRHGHVGRVGDERRALHDRLGATFHFHGELREVLEHLGHLIAALATADVDDRVAVGELGQRLRDHRLAAAERARNGCRAALHTPAFDHFNQFDYSFRLSYELFDSFRKKITGKERPRRAVRSIGDGWRRASRPRASFDARAKSA